MSLLFSMKPSDLISPAYLEMQKELHARPKGYGGKGDKWAPAVAVMVDAFSAWSVLDYGSGQGSLKKALLPLLTRSVRINEYDPAIPGKDAQPEFADLVTVTDVLEHVEPDRLSTVLAHLKVLARKAVFVVIATRPSNKTMTDGRNAHLIIESGEWWHLKMIEAGFTVNEGPTSPLKKVSREWVAVLTC